MANTSKACETTDTQRLDQVAALLATGFLRLRAKQVRGQAKGGSCR